MEKTFKCLYCNEKKTIKEQSKEHVIPQAIGGDFVPKRFLINNVCKTCNNNYGLFVDASYTKSAFITNQMSLAAQCLYQGLEDQPIPLFFIGNADIEGLNIPNNSIAEHWIGPSGETIIWIHNNDERMKWYAGGNPRTTKEKESVVYFTVTSNDLIRLKIGFCSFTHAFKKYKKIRKIPCFGIEKDIYSYFSTPTEVDNHNIKAIMHAINKKQLINNELITNTEFDHRFIAKIILGLGYSLFREPFLETKIAQIARKKLLNNDILLSGTSIYESSPVFKELGYAGAVALAVIKVDNHYIFHLNINNSKGCMYDLEDSGLTSDYIHKFGIGYILLIFPHLKKYLEISLEDLISHKTREKEHQFLVDIDKRIESARKFSDSLSNI